MKKISLFLCCIAAASQVNAGGYRVSAQGQKALGMGHAGVAMAESAETVFFNPGAVAQLDKDSVTGGITLISTKNKYTNPDTDYSASTDTPLGTPVSLYMVKKLTPEWSAGFGLYTPFGSKVEWEKDWAGSHLINNIDLQSIFLQPTFSFKVNENFSVGGGPIVAISSVELNRNLDPATADPATGNRSNVTLEDSNIVDYGYSLGAFFKLNDKVNYGISYRSEIIVKSEGDADFRDIAAGVPSAIFVDGGYTAELPLPAELTLGFTYQYSDKTIIAFDYNYTFWDVYEDLTFEFDSVTVPSLATSNNPRNYKNSSIYRLGVQHQKTPKLQLRGGVYYDETPIRDGYFAPETPRTDFVGFTAGLTYEMRKNLELDMSAFYLYFPKEENSYDYSDYGDFEGEYEVDAWAIGFGLTYAF